MSLRIGEMRIIFRRDVVAVVTGFERKMTGWLNHCPVITARLIGTIRSIHPYADRPTS
jgi:hypothetical protein